MNEIDMNVLLCFKWKSVCVWNKNLTVKYDDSYVKVL